MVILGGWVFLMSEVTLYQLHTSNHATDLQPDPCGIMKLIFNC